MSNITYHTAFLIKHLGRMTALASEFVDWNPSFAKNMPLADMARIKCLQKDHATLGKILEKMNGS